MKTTKGEIAEEKLTKVVSEEDIPCGKMKRTKFFDETGEMVREDLEALVDPMKVEGYTEFMKAVSKGA